MVKIFTSGSFFDPHEIPPEFLSDVATSFKGKLVIAETRPEFIDREVMVSFIDLLDDGSWKTPLYCAIGLETSNDRIREKCINKGFTFLDFERAAATAHSARAGVKAYLLFKPLFLTEGESAGAPRLRQLHDQQGVLRQRRRRRRASCQPIRRNVHLMKEKYP